MPNDINTYQNEILSVKNKFNEATIDIINIKSNLENLFQFSESNDFTSNISFDYGSLNITYSFKTDILNSATSEIKFIFSIKNKQLDIINNLSFMNINSKERNNSTISIFNALLSDCLTRISSIENLLFDQISILKKKQTLVRKLTKTITKLTFEIQEIDLKDEIQKIQSVLVPLSRFCIYSFLCNYCNIPFKDKPTDSDIALLKDTLFHSEKYRFYYSKDLYRDFFDQDFYFYIFFIQGDKYNFKKVSLNVLIRHELAPLKIKMRKLNSVKAINAELSNQITFKDNIIDSDSCFFDIIGTSKLEGSVKDLHCYLKKYIIENTLIKF